MTIELYFAFIAATLVLMAIPGPNVALIAATSVSRGFRHGLTAVAGTSFAMVLQLFVVGAGLNGFLLFLSEWMHVLRLCGAAYLVILGVSMWRSKTKNLKHKTGEASHKTIFVRGLIVSLTNPKTLLFYGAFFPQFVTPGADAARQILLLAATFMLVAVCVDSIWAFAASRLRAMNLVSNLILNRLGGGLLICAGLGLALARKP